MKPFYFLFGIAGLLLLARMNKKDGAAKVPNFTELLMGAPAVKTSQAGIDFIKRHEGLRLTVYKDQAGLDTIGYGHLNVPGASYQQITAIQAEEILRRDLARGETAITKSVTVPLSENEFDALSSFVFNVGPGAFQKSTLLKKINAGDKAGAANEFTRWVFITDPNTGQKVVSNGLMKRRTAEKAVFANGDYSG